MSIPPVNYGLWISSLDVNDALKAFVEQGKFQVVIVSSSYVDAASQKIKPTQNIMNALEELNTWGITVVADHLTPNSQKQADLRTEASRENIIAQLVENYNKVAHLIKGLVDDTEGYVGSSENHLQYYNLGSQAPFTVPYMPYLAVPWLKTYTGSYSAISMTSGASDIVSYKGNLLSAAQSHQRCIVTSHPSSVGYLETIMQAFSEVYDEDPILFNDVQCFSFWWYRSFSDSMKKRWIEIVEGTAPPPPPPYELSPLHSLIFRNTETVAYQCCQRLRNTIISEDLHKKLHPLV